MSRGRLFRFLGGQGIWRREWLIFWRFQWPFFFVLTRTRSSVEWKLFKWQCWETFANSFSTDPWLETWAQQNTIHGSSKSSRVESEKTARLKNWLPSNCMAAIHNCWCFQTGSPFECLSSKFLAKMNHEKWKGWRSHLNHLSEKIHTNVEAYRKPSLKSLWKNTYYPMDVSEQKETMTRCSNPKIVYFKPCQKSNSTIPRWYIMHLKCVYIYIHDMVWQPFPAPQSPESTEKNTQLIRVRLVKVRNTVKGQIDLTTRWPSVGPGGLRLFGEAYFQGQKRGNLLRDLLRIFFWLAVSWYQWVSRIVCVYIYTYIHTYIYIYVNKLDVAKWNLLTVQLMTYHLQLGIFLRFFSTLLTEGIEFHFDFQRGQFVIRDYLGWYLQTSLRRNNYSSRAEFDWGKSGGS